MMGGWPINVSRLVHTLSIMGVTSVYFSAWTFMTLMMYQGDDQCVGGQHPTLISLGRA